jgi:hypothetical protein
MRNLSWLFLTASWLAAQATCAPTPDTFGSIDAAAKELSEITKLELKHKVPSDTISREKFKIYVEETIADQIPPEEVQIQELILKRFGLVPDVFDLKKSTVDIITEQAAAFYDFRRKKLFLMEGSAPSSQPVLIVHELAHALADQHYDLAKYIKRGKSDDASLARMAVMEGQATWLMLESAARKSGQSLTTSTYLADAMSGGADQMITQYPVLAAAPLYIRASLLFPYQQGFRFQQALVAKHGTSSFTMVFERPPLSSQQVLHPEKYIANIAGVEAKLPSPARKRDFREIAEGSVGEFDHAVLLEQYGTRQLALELAPKWRGGAFSLVEGKRNKKQQVLLYASEWESEDAAQRMFESYRQVLKGKWKTFVVESEDESSFRGQGDAGPFEVTRRGTRVSSVEGAPSDTLRN